MIRRAEERGEIKPGDTLIEATSGNTGIALAMAAAIRGYRMVLIMPEDLSRRARADDEGLRRRADPHAADRAAWNTRATWPSSMQREGKGRVLDQFANADNPRIHYETTGPEIWEQTGGRITHFVSAMGTTGTITGVSRFLKEKNPAVRIIGAQPSEGSRIPGIRKWPQEYLPKIYDPSARRRAGATSARPMPRRCARRLAREEGIFAGISAAGALLGRAAGRAAGRERDDRVRRLRPRRPLPVDRRVSGVSREHDAVLPALRDAARVDRAARKTAARSSGCAAPPAAGRTGTTRRRCSPR